MKPTRDLARSLGDAPTLLADSKFSSFVCFLTQGSQPKRLFGATGNGDFGGDI